MQSFLAKCAAVGIVAGGFTLTGDVGRLAAHGRRLIDATGVPTDRTPDVQSRAVSPPPAGPVALPPAVAAPAAVPAASPPAATAVVPQPTSPPSSAGSSTAAPSTGPAQTRQVWRLPGDPPPDAPVGGPVTVPLPASGGVDAVDLRHVASGTRLLVWIRQPDTAGLGQRGGDMLAIDIIAPETGEALVHRHAAVSAAGRGPSHATPRRVRVVSGSLARGQTLQLAPLRGVHGTGPNEEVGRVLAIEVKSP